MKIRGAMLGGLFFAALVLLFCAPALADMDAPSSGFHIGAGLGLSGAESNGIGTKLKVGYNFDNNWRLYFLNLNHGYMRYLPEYDKGAFKTSDDDVSEMWMTSFAGVGADYFVVDQLAFNFALGVSTDMPLTLDSTHEDAMDDMDDDTPYRDSAENGVAMVMGFSVPILGNDTHSVSLDPSMLMTWAVPEGGQHIMSRRIYSLNVVYNFH